MSVSGENNLLFFDFFIVLSKFLSAYFAKKEAKDLYALSDLKNKEAIDISCGRYLGPIMDAAIDLQTGHIVGIILPGGLFGQSFLPYQAVELIGIDVVLVNLELATDEPEMV